MRRLEHFVSPKTSRAGRSLTRGLTRGLTRSLTRVNGLRLIQFKAAILLHPKFGFRTFLDFLSLSVELNADLQVTGS